MANPGMQCTASFLFFSAARAVVSRTSSVSSENPTSAASLYFLAETLVALGKKDEARAVRQRLLDAPVDPDWAPEDREFKGKGRALIATLRSPA